MTQCELHANNIQKSDPAYLEYYRPIYVLSQLYKTQKYNRNSHKGEIPMASNGEELQPMFLDLNYATKHMFQ